MKQENKDRRQHSYLRESDIATPAQTYQLLARHRVEEVVGSDRTRDIWHYMERLDWVEETSWIYPDRATKMAEKLLDDVSEDKRAGTNTIPLHQSEKIDFLSWLHGLHILPGPAQIKLQQEWKKALPAVGTSLESDLSAFPYLLEFGSERAVMTMILQYSRRYQKDSLTFLSSPTSSMNDLLSLVGYAQQVDDNVSIRDIVATTERLYRQGDIDKLDPGDIAKSMNILRLSQDKGQAGRAIDHVVKRFRMKRQQALNQIVCDSTNNSASLSDLRDPEMREILRVRGIRMGNGIPEVIDDLTPELARQWLKQQGWHTIHAPSVASVDAFNAIRKAPDRIASGAVRYYLSSGDVAKVWALWPDVHSDYEVGAVLHELQKFALKQGDNRILHDAEQEYTRRMLGRGHADIDFDIGVGYMLYVQEMSNPHDVAALSLLPQVCAHIEDSDRIAHSFIKATEHLPLRHPVYQQGQRVLQKKIREAMEGNIDRRSFSTLLRTILYLQTADTRKQY